MVIDLTDTQRYYDPAKVIQKGVIHRKESLNIHDNRPLPEDRIEKLVKEIKDFRDEHPNDIVVLHW